MSEASYATMTSASAKLHTEYTRGSIKKIVLRNFMIHKDLCLDASARCNLILGPNGSGEKEFWIMSASVVALDHTLEICVLQESRQSSVLLQCAFQGMFL